MGEVTVVRDPSSIRLQVEEDQIHVVVSCPGMRSNDIEVRVIDDDVLRVTGETRKGATVYRLARSVQLPRAVEMDKMTASHEDGELTILVQRKIRRVTIPVVSAVPVTPVLQANAGPIGQPEKDE